VNLLLKLGGKTFHVLVFAFLLDQLLLMTDSNLLKHLVSLLDILLPLLHLFLFL
jgi:hypothetical protein